MKHLLVTNDFPPKIGGIQNYLWELWKRLPPTDTVVLTTPHRDAETWDAQHGLTIERTREPVLLPHPGLIRRINTLVAEHDIGLVLLDPLIMVGPLGPRLEVPYGIILHGAEVALPCRIPLLRRAMANILTGAEVVVAAGGYPLAEAERCANSALPAIEIPPGVDPDRFVPVTAQERTRIRARYGIAPDTKLVVGLSRLVPRKGFDTLIEAAARIGATDSDMMVLIGGTGRDESRLRALAAKKSAPVAFVGRVDDDDLPSFYAMADGFAMLCRQRWGGLEQEGFGIVFLEAAACGVPQVAGRSGGSHEAVLDGTTGIVVDQPNNVHQVVAAIQTILEPSNHVEMSKKARTFAHDDCSYDQLAEKLNAALKRIMLQYATEPKQT